MEAKSGEHKSVGLSLETAAEMLGIDAARVKILAGQGRLRTTGPQDAPRYDLDSVLSMQAENLIREMLEEAGDKRPELRAKIDTLAMLQYQRGREGTQRAEHWEILERIEKVNPEANANTERQNAELQEMNDAAERRLEEMRAMEEGVLRRLEPQGRSRRETG
jgi:hypothetical protein